MSAEQGNSYARKWTVETVEVYLNQIETDAKDTDTLYISEALAKLRITRKAWSYWRRIFSRREDLMEQMDLIEELFEIKLFRGAMKEGLPMTMAIFGLKNNHHWTDKPVPPAEAKQSEGMLIELMDDVIVMVDVKGVSGKFKRIGD